MAAPLRLLIEFVAATLGAVAADGKQDINVAPNEVVHRFRNAYNRKRMASPPGLLKERVTVPSYQP
jgi:hypothetical protein